MPKSLKAAKPPTPSSFPIQLEDCREPKVADLNVHVVVDEEVPQLKVAMYHILLVQVLRNDGRAYLHGSMHIQLHKLVGMCSSMSRPPISSFFYTYYISRLDSQHYYA